MFPFETNERRYVRASMSRDENTFKGTGTFSGFLVNMFGPNEDAVIERLDRDLRWTLDLRKKQYTECPLKGCVKPAKPAQGAPPGHQHFGFELDGLPPGVDPKAPFELTFTIVQGDRATEVKTHLD